MHTATITHKRERRKYPSTVEVKAECPLCGHTATLVITGTEKEYQCPDRFCPNCKDKPHE
jgi:transcription elongation factor Elf1